MGCPLMVLVFSLIVIGLSAFLAATAAWLLSRRMPLVSEIRLAMVSSMVPALIMAVLSVFEVARVTSGDCPASELGCDMATLAQFVIGLAGIFGTLLSIAVGFLAAIFTLRALRRR
jgi:hypothetical protein